MSSITSVTLNFDGSGNNAPVSATARFAAGSGKASSVTAPFVDGNVVISDPDGGIQASPLISISVADATGTLQG